jgi:hypothetical protein
VRYARGYRPITEIEPLLARSAIVLRRRPDVDTPDITPAVLDFSDFADGSRTLAWASRLLAD